MHRPITSSTVLVRRITLFNLRPIDWHGHTFLSLCAERKTRGNEKCYRQGKPAYSMTDDKKGQSEEFVSSDEGPLRVKCRATNNESLEKKNSQASCCRDCGGHTCSSQKTSKYHFIPEPSVRKHPSCICILIASSVIEYHDACIR